MLTCSIVASSRERVGGVPSGLDGNPNPVVTAERTAILDLVAERVLASQRDRVLVAIDGRPGSGKSTFADELVTIVRDADRHVIRSTTDSFHRPRNERMRLGSTSADGYIDESHQLDLIRSALLRPFAFGNETVQVSAFDEPSDSPRIEHVDVSEQAVLIFDGLFLQRTEFADMWEIVVYLDADERCDGEWLDFLLGDGVGSRSEQASEIDERLHRSRWPRYRDGWSAYVAKFAPALHATVVVDNNDFAQPRIVAP